MNIFFYRNNESVLSVISVTVISETEKAVQVQSKSRNGKTMTCWLPKKAIVSKTHEGIVNGQKLSCTNHELAKWFKATGYTDVFINACREPAYSY